MGRIDDALATFLINSLWQVTLVAGLTWGLIRPVRSAAARHGLFAFSLVLSLTLPIASMVPPAREGVPAPVMPVSAPAPGLAGSNARWSAAVHLPRGLSLVLTAAYLLFFAWRLALAWRAWRSAAAIRTTATTMSLSEEWGRVAERCRAAFELVPIRITSSPTLRVPAAIGARSPIITLPEGLLARLSIDELTAIFGHEMAHIRRRDLGLNLLYELLYLPLSFHPAAAFLKRRVAISREQACDDLVVARLMPPQLYARSLVRIAGRISEAKEISYGVAACDERSLESRIQRLLAPATDTSVWSAAWAAIAVGTLSICSCVEYAAALYVGPATSLPSERPVVTARGVDSPLEVPRAIVSHTEWTAARRVRAVTNSRRPSGGTGGPRGQGSRERRSDGAPGENGSGMVDGTQIHVMPSGALAESSGVTPVRESSISLERGEAPRSLLAAAQAALASEAAGQDRATSMPARNLAGPSRRDIPVFKTKKRMITWLLVGIGSGYALSQLDVDHEARLRRDRHAGG
jgi:beta-lactamase regulating signal transducer with metallopeptidase domain